MFFHGFGVSWIEWLNGVSVNVIFDDPFTAERALQTLSIPVPVVEGGPCGNAVWHLWSAW